MKTKFAIITGVPLLAVLLAFSGPACAADTMNDYSITPPFIQESIKPNMLFMIDNSASMYDLTYVDEGRKTCSGTGAACSKNSDCPNGETCSTFLRQPYYCYDQTYKSSKTYIGNFEPAKFYQYSFSNQQFEELSAFSCTATGTQEKKEITGTLCVLYANTSPYAVSTFIATGNYLNWLTASKFDVQKKILTGGKYVGTQILSESRGCVGQSFIKEANAGDFVNYSSPETNNANTSLGITFGVRGPYDLYNRSAPSPGGQTYIDIYKGNYNQADCQDAVYQLQYGGNADIKKSVEACLNFSSGGTQTAVTKTKVAFQQSMQACWQYRNGKDIGTDDINTVKNQCTDIYAGYATCSNNPDQVCTTDANCGSGNTCMYGPAAIVPGNPALLCSSDYEGQYYFISSGSGICQKKNQPDMGPCTSDSDCSGGYKCVGAAGSGWSLKAGVTESQMIQTHRDFCNNLMVPNVVDPTDAPSDTALYDNLPAIISGIGVEAQLNQPIATLSTKVRKTTEPQGLVQNFDGLIRMGLMSFNFLGSATESGTVTGFPVTKVCSTDTTKVCTSDIDCPSSGTCSAATSGTQNKDGASVLHYIGYGHCSTTTTTPCATKANCPSGEKCISDGVGSHATAGSLVKAIDDLKAASWTPFAESFYNAIGYFGKASSDSTGKTSRTDLRINAADFSDTLNPSEYYCQNNNILLISDGMSTADRNTAVDNLAKLYTAAGGSTSWTASCPQYAGSVNLDNLAWIARNRNINSFSTSTASTATPQQKNEFIKTYVVFNGASNGLSGECNSETLMTNTATKGGTAIYKAEDPQALAANLTAALREIAAGSASGTAASIVSNRGQSGANLITAIFYPEKDFGKDSSGNEQKLAWIGDMQNYWYYFDPYIANSTIREDTNGDGILDLKDDYRIDFIFDDSTSKTLVKRYQDDGLGTYTLINQVEPDALKALWKAGVELYKRDLTVSPYRKLLINKGGSLFTLTTGQFANLTSTLWTDIKDYLNVADDTTAANVMKYIYGFDVSGYRKRTVSGYAGLTTANAATGEGVWKLGDVVTSTPKVQSDRPLSGYHFDYGDSSYESFIQSNDYAGRGMVYVGANDGALHAINLGKVSSLSGGTKKAQLTGSGLGTEEWAFVPANALPYLKYFTEPNYTHLYYVDTTTLVLDASIHKPSSCTATDYWNCDRKTATSSGNLNLSDTSWRTVLIGSMGLGGASRAADATCTNCVKAPRNVDGFKEHGLSSVFALNVTDPKNPAMMWEFSHPDLGYTTSEPAIVRINGKMDSSTDPDSGKNGRWFAVFASGPTGPIDATSHQFMGKSDKTLKFFVLDINASPPFVENSNYWIIDTLSDGSQIADAFGGSLASNAIDTDKNNRFSSGFYSTDVVYAGYVKPKTESGVTTWTDGGLLRLLTKEDSNPANWVVSKVIDGVGPVTASIEKLYDDYDKQSGKPVLWLYFGSGRYFFKNTADGIDSADNQMVLYGVKDPCYSTATGASKDMDAACTASVSIADLTNQSSNTPNDSLVTGKTAGWYINLDGTGTYGGREYKAERVITTPSVRTNGLLQFTTFKPTADICGFGGETLFWLLDYATGAAPPIGTLKGKVTIQLSTGAIVVIDLSKLTSGSFSRGGRQIDVGVGKPPAPPPPADTLKKPVKKVLHIQER